MMEDPAEPKTLSALLKKTRISSGTIPLWKQNHDWFMVRYEEAKRAMNRKSTTYVPVKLPGNAKTGWEEDFLETYGATGRFHYACELASVHYTTVTSRMTEGSSTFDPNFLAKFKMTDQQVNSRIVDAAHKRAIEDQSDTMIKFLLSTKMPDQFGRTSTIGIKVSGTVEHRVLEDRAKKFLEGIYEVVDEKLPGNTDTQEPRRLPEAV